MRKLASESKRRADAKLADRESDLVDSTKFDWDSISPKLSDKEERDALVKAVKEATIRNENIGQLHKRLKEMGSVGISVSEKLGGII